LQSITSGSESFTYQYHSESNLLEKITAPQHSVTYSYVPNRDMISRIHNQTQDGSTLSAYDYSYDALGRRTQRLQSGAALSASSLDRFSYNARSEVIASDNDLNQALDASYAYDSIGNRLTATGLNNISYSSNALNQYTRITVDEDSQSPSYDFDGNLISDTQGWTFQWNAENRLKSASNGQQTLYFTYDYQGRLVKKEDGSQIEVYAYDGWNRIASFEQTSTLTLQKTFLWGLDLSGSLQGAGGVGGLLKEGDLYPAYDANGNIMQKLDAAGEVAMSVAYDAFGQLTSGQLVGEYGFSSKPRITGINWYYYGFRYYDPVTGRWPSRDPIGENGGLNLYGFIENDLINTIDLYGLTLSRPSTVPYATDPGHINCLGHAVGAGHSVRPAPDHSLQDTLEGFDASCTGPTNQECKCACDETPIVVFVYKGDPADFSDPSASWDGQSRDFHAVKGTPSCDGTSSSWSHVTGNYNQNNPRSESRPAPDPNSSNLRKAKGRFCCCQPKG
jgi:RHS repeat-associated protein